VVATANISLVIVFGDALMKGHFKKAMAALIGVVAVVAVVKILRKRALARVASGEAA
jgi:hypothetical protein